MQLTHSLSKCQVYIDTVKAEGLNMNTLLLKEAESKTKNGEISSHPSCKHLYTKRVIPQTGLRLYFNTQEPNHQSLKKGNAPCHSIILPLNVVVLHCMYSINLCVGPAINW